jgi:hypothetical protein
MTRQTLSSFATEIWLLVADRLLEDEVTQRCGPRYERSPERDVTRFVHQVPWGQQSIVDSRTLHARAGAPCGLGVVSTQFARHHFRRQTV